MGLDIIILLLVAGVVLLMCEIVVPGGVVGGLGAMLILVGIVGGFLYDPMLGLWLLIGSVIGGAIAFYLWMKYFPRSRLGKRFILQEDGKAWYGCDDRQTELMGKVGRAHGPLHPVGTALIDGRRVDVVTRGEMLSAGTPVKVIEVAGNRVVVTEADEPPEPPDNGEAAAEQQAGEE